MKEFRVNDYITLKLEGNRTIIYLDGERFDQCKQLVLNIPINKIQDYDEINSIDEASEINQTQEFRRDIRIPSKIEFWGHCSNLQVWCENGYDTRLLHSNLAFPLLKRLVELGDPQAKKVFKEEIAKRFECGIVSTQIFLASGGYLSNFTKDEINTIIYSRNHLNEWIENKCQNRLQNPISTYYLLRELSKSGDRKAKKLLHKVIPEIILLGSKIVNSRIHFRKLLRDLSKDELKFIFNSINHNLSEVLRVWNHNFVVENDPLREILPDIPIRYQEFTESVLNPFISLYIKENTKIDRNFYRNLISCAVVNHFYIILNQLIKSDYLKHLTEKDLNFFFNKIDHQKIDLFNLGRLVLLGDEHAKKKLIEEIKEEFLIHGFDIVDRYITLGVFKDFKGSELTNLLMGKDPFLNITMSQRIKKILLGGNIDLIEYFLQNGYLNFISPSLSFSFISDLPIDIVFLIISFKSDWKEAFERYDKFSDKHIGSLIHTSFPKDYRSLTYMLQNIESFYDRKISLYKDAGFLMKSLKTQKGLFKKKKQTWLNLFEDPELKATFRPEFYFEPIRLSTVGESLAVPLLKGGIFSINDIALAPISYLKKELNMGDNLIKNLKQSAYEYLKNQTTDEYFI